MSQKKHVLFFTSSISGGGAEKHLARIIEQIDRQKFRLSLATMKSVNADDTLLPDDVDLHILNTGRINSSTLRIIRVIRPLRNLIKTEKPDILCSVMHHTSIAALLASHNLPTKSVLSIQTVSSLSLAQSKPGKVILWLIPNLFQKADRIVAISQGVADDLIKLVPGISGKVKVIYNAGVDRGVYDGACETLEMKTPQNEPLIIAVGRLTEAKGYPDLIEALRLVREKIPAHLWIVGEGEQRQLIEAKIRELGLTNCVRLLGFKRNPYKYMAAADVFVSSSLWEGFGNVIVEAMACGTPVVATDCPSGPSEIITQDDNGLLVPPADEKALAEAIIRILKNPSLRHRLGEKGEIRANDFDSKKIAQEYEELFLRLLKETNAG